MAFLVDGPPEMLFLTRAYLVMNRRTKSLSVHHWPVKTIGIDISSQPLATASCSILWENGQARLESAEHSVDDARLESLLLEPAAKIGIDVPLGWPDEFIAALVRHRDGAPFGEADTGVLVRRRTDTWVWRTTQQLPLSVSTDRISYPAMRFARVADRLQGLLIDRGGSGKVVEVYPAAALRVWKLQYRRYKRDKGRDVLAAIVDEIADRCPWFSADDGWTRALIQNDHIFDAFVCALVARAHATARCHPIPAEDAEAAGREGWIAVPNESTLEGLA